MAAEVCKVPEVLHSGQVVRDFEIMKPLGKGKFSIVYMAKRLQDGLLCALKKINIFDTMTPKQRDKCLKEVKLLQSLDHPNIVRFLSSFVDQHELLIIVEWAEKGDLKRLIRKALQSQVRFKETDIWSYCKQLSSALDHMHGRRIMHRDIKPANIFIGSDGSLMLGDLGLGRFFSSQTLEAFSKVGTPLYMSPEVLQGAGYDMRSDVWSLGCVFYELAVLRSPFKSETQISLYDLFVRISKGHFPPLPETFSLDFRELVDRMLQLEPPKRSDCSQVREVCAAHLKVLMAAYASKQEKSGAGGSSGSRPRPSPLLVMDDIVEKLKLLDCEEQLLRPCGFPMIHRCFFAQRVVVPGQCTQFQVMYKLLTWLLGMLAERDGKGILEVPCDAGNATKDAAEQLLDQLAPGGAAPTDENPHARRRGQADAAALRKLLPVFASRGINASSEATMVQLRQGYGDGVCLIVNELINQELMARDFHFEAPAWATSDTLADEVEEEAPSEVEESEALCSRSSSGEAEDEAANSDGEAGTSLRLGPRTDGAGSLEPVLQTRVDPQLFREEAKRVAPLLRSAPLSQGSWESSVGSVRTYVQRIADSGVLAHIPKGLGECRRTCSSQLALLESQEARMNNEHTVRVAELAQLHAGIIEETREIAELHSRIEARSTELASLGERTEQAQAEVASSSDAIHDSEKLSRLKAAARQLVGESRQLEVQTRSLQADLMCRRRSV